MSRFAETSFKGYLITDCGKVYSTKTNQFLRPTANRLGYLIVRVSLGQRKTKGTLRIHREVAKAFVANPHNLPEVNHIDLDKSNNTFNNLEWCTRKQNVQHAFSNGAFLARDIKHSKATKQQKLEAIDLYRQGHSVKQIANQLSASPNTVYAWFNALIDESERKRIKSINISRGKLNAKDS